MPNTILPTGDLLHHFPRQGWPDQIMLLTLPLKRPSNKWSRISQTLWQTSAHNMHQETSIAHWISALKGVYSCLNCKHAFPYMIAEFYEGQVWAEAVIEIFCNFIIALLKFRNWYEGGRHRVQHPKNHNFLFSFANREGKKRKRNVFSSWGIIPADTSAVNQAGNKSHHAS